MPQDADSTLYTIVDDELYEELCALEGQQVVQAAVWEDSLADGLSAAVEGAEASGAEAGAEAVSFDIDLYLEGGVFFELYSVACFPSLDGEPLIGQAAAAERLAGLVRQQATLAEVAVDEEENLVLVLRPRRGAPLYLAVGVWLLAEWDELPEAG